MGFGTSGVRPFGLLGLGSLYKHKTITLREKNFTLHADSYY